MSGGGVERGKTGNSGHQGRRQCHPHYPGDGVLILSKYDLPLLVLRIYIMVEMTQLVVTPVKSKAEKEPDLGMAIFWEECETGQQNRRQASSDLSGSVSRSRTINLCSGMSWQRWRR